ncbi:MAG: hypothetical protein HRT58_22170 [Crocinitomicaceae bacterium]|nr:hypothetical protein [Flavobacteriales bacterium]NQZ38383.1 hypothetical protein [Crocinitomicaceae bacterium]
MILEAIFLKEGGQFSNYVREWADTRGIEVVSFEFKPNQDQEPHGLLLVNENHDITKEIGEVYSLYDRKHIPTQKIDINGTLQVAMNSFRMWADKNKCKRVLILGDNDLVKNENLERFFSNLK